MITGARLFSTALVLNGFLSLALSPAFAEEQTQNTRNHFEADFEFLKVEIIS
jgi:hypothetical protein